MSDLELTKSFIEISEFLARNGSYGTDAEVKCPFGTLKCHFEFEVELEEDKYDD